MILSYSSSTSLRHSVDHLLLPYSNLRGTRLLNDKPLVIRINKQVDFLYNSSSIKWTNYKEIPSLFHFSFVFFVGPSPPSSTPITVIRVQFPPLSEKESKWYCWRGNVHLNWVVFKLDMLMMRVPNIKKKTHLFFSCVVLTTVINTCEWMTDRLLCFIHSESLKRREKNKVKLLCSFLSVLIVFQLYFSVA